MRKLPLILALLAVLLSTATAIAQESQTQADFRGEATRFKQSCEGFTFKKIPGCADLLFTDHPLHIAVGSIAPQNGFGAGGAYVGHYTPNELWRTSWDADAIASDNASWRAGFYFKAIHTPIEKIKVVTTTSGPAAHSNLSVHPYTVFNLAAQSISLNQLFYYGLGPNSVKANATVFGMTETIAGTDAIVPVLHSLNASLLGEVNGRFVNLRGNHSESSSSIEQLFTEASAPGLATQPPFAQLGEGLRLEPTLLNDHLQIDYLAQFQQYVAPSNDHYSFRRYTFDLDHTIPLYHNAASYGPMPTNGPDECAASPGATKCSAIQRNREGSVEVRLLITESIASAGSVVPFYFQPTLGGSDINGNSWLPSYSDYRFRAPNALLLREAFEHSIWGPIGFAFSADEGKVALSRNKIDFNQLAHSFSAGITLRAGGLPALSLAFAWGGPEGTHTIANVDTSLLGGSTRPSLF
ncbi:MAG: hypothetical protein WB573_08680 [Terracidiphilus sp.]